MPSILAEMPVEYLVKEDGQRTGVVLRWEDYRALLAFVVDDPDMLPGFDQQTLSALAEGMLAPRFQERLDELLALNESGKLDASDQEELDQLLDRIDQINLVKARAAYTLQKLFDIAPSA